LTSHFYHLPRGKNNGLLREDQHTTAEITAYSPDSGTIHPLLCCHGLHWLLREGVISRVRIVLTCEAASAKYATNKEEGMGSYWECCLCDANILGH